MPKRFVTALVDSLPRLQSQLSSRRRPPSLCLRCSLLPKPQHQRRLPPVATLSLSHRTLTTTGHALARGGKQDSKRTVPHNAAKSEGIDPFDLSAYDSAITRAHEHLKSELSKIKAGGRDPEAIEAVRVQLVKGEKATSALGDIASVVPRGRNVVVLVGEKDHIKPILSALASAPHNLTATTAPHDPLTLFIPVPPTTAESRQAAMALASEKGEAAMFALREARGAQRKKLRALELAKKVVPDEMKRALAEMEKVNERAVGEGKKLVEGCRRGLQG